MLFEDLSQKAFGDFSKILGKTFSSICTSIGFALAITSHAPATIAAPDPATFTTFAEWCFNRNSLPMETQHTVDVMLQKAETKDCYGAQDWLSDQTELLLFRRRLSDLRPLASLTNLQELWLYTNHISDISPLANLTNLTKLWIYDNHIADVTPLTGLTNLTVLSLDDNDIVDASPLATLTNLTVLNLQANEIVEIHSLETLKGLTVLNLKGNPIEKERCPFKPRSICYF
ncbi:MAG: leucine-rich repeat domain-containing protein [Geitlerinemataceae cyanobacterium]